MGEIAIRKRQFVEFVETRPTGFGNSAHAFVVFFHSVQKKLVNMDGLNC
jgi:hypothetical protein